MSKPHKRAELYAAALALVIGAPLVVLLGMAVADGVRRYREAPLRAMLGDRRFEELSEEPGGFPHYLGRERLAPDFELRDRQGRPWKMSDQRGKVVVLNFWSVTCPPCLEEMPSLEVLGELAKRWDDVEVVAINTDASWEEVEPVLPARSNLTHLIDPDKSVTRGMFGTELYPETWIIDGEGIVRFRYDGAFDWSNPLVLQVIDSFR